MNTDRIAWDNRTNTGRCSRSDQVASFQRHKSCDKSEYSTGIEDHIGYRRILFHFAIDESLNPKRRKVNFS